MPFCSHKLTNQSCYFPCSVFFFFGVGVDCFVLRNRKSTSLVRGTCERGWSQESSSSCLTLAPKAECLRRVWGAQPSPLCGSGLEKAEQHGRSSQVLFIHCGTQKAAGALLPQEVFFLWGGGLGDGRNMTLLLFGFYLGRGSVGWVGGRQAVSLKSQL